MPIRRSLLTILFIALSVSLLSFRPLAVSAQPVVTTQVPTAGVPTPVIPTVWNRTELSVAECRDRPKIDGKLDDPCWSSATHITGFYREEGSAAVAEQTEAWICADKAHLYIAFHCIDHHPELIRASEVHRNGSVYLDDYVEVDIDSHDTRHAFSSFVVTARGTQRDAIEGGTPDNITWIGDWRAASRPTGDGWTCEISIPFGLLRYSRNSTTFGLLLGRKLAREATREIWPYIPPSGLANEVEYTGELAHLQLPYYAPRPVVMPYVLASAGQGTSSREGVDVKYPLNTTITGVATLFPDFRTVEQNVVGINFTYDEKYIPDRRPFFAEGSDYFPYSDVFYSRRIGEVDGGLKVVGKQDGTSIGLVTTDNWESDRGRATQVMALRHDMGLLSRFEVDYAGDNREGTPSNRIGKVESTYGWKVGPDVWSLTGNFSPSWYGGAREDRKDYLGFNVKSPDGRPSLYFNYDNIGPSFRSDLGYVPENNKRGVGFGLEQFNRFDKGPLEIYDIGFDSNTSQYYTGGFFHDLFSPYLYLRDHKGLGIAFTPSIGQRNQFHDHTNSTTLSWGRKTLYQRGSVGYTAGDLAGQTYKFLSIYQGILASKLLNATANYNVVDFGSSHRMQTVIDATYIVTSERSISLRLVQQTGTGNDGTNLFIAYAQQVRAGADVFLLLGDPNSTQTRDMITLKIVKPF